MTLHGEGNLKSQRPNMESYRARSCGSLPKKEERVPASHMSLHKPYYHI